MTQINLNYLNILLLLIICPFISASTDNDSPFESKWTAEGMNFEINGQNYSPRQSQTQQDSMTFHSLWSLAFAGIDNPQQANTLNDLEVSALNLFFTNTQDLSFLQNLLKTKNDPNSLLSCKGNFNHNFSNVFKVFENTDSEISQNDLFQQSFTDSIQARSLTGIAVSGWLYQGDMAPDGYKDLNKPYLNTEIRTFPYPYYSYYPYYPLWRYSYRPYCYPWYNASWDVYKFHQKHLDNYNVYPVTGVSIEMMIDNKGNTSFGGYMITDPTESRFRP